MATDYRIPFLPVKVIFKHYVGLKNGKKEIFKFSDTPTKESHPQYAAVIGPFRTKQAAVLTIECGSNNPHIQCVNDAERIVKEIHGSD